MYAWSCQHERMLESVPVEDQYQVLNACMNGHINMRACLEAAYLFRWTTFTQPYHHAPSCHENNTTAGQFCR